VRHERGERERLAAEVEAGRAREAALADRLRAETVTPHPASYPSDTLMTSL
jgi:hypothetical protein